MRAAARFLAILLLVVAVLAALLFIAVAIDHDDQDQLWGGVALAVLAGLVAVVLWFGQRALRKADPDDGTAVTSDLSRAEHGETVQLRAGRLRWILLLLGFLLLAAFTIPFAFIEPSILTIAGALLFGSGTIVAAWALSPNGMYLRISRDGLLVRQMLRTRAYGWNDIDNFRVFEVHARYHTQRFVGFDLRTLSAGERSLWQTIGRGISGVDVGLPDNYGMDPEHLAQALQRIRKRLATERSRGGV